MVSGGPPSKLKHIPNYRHLPTIVFLPATGEPVKASKLYGGANEDEVFEQIKAKKKLGDALIGKDMKALINQVN